jgi:uncharacterized membrane protein YhhN
MPLIQVAVRSVGELDPPARRGLTAAHALSWTGDVALLSKRDSAFLIGLGSFFGAHVAYLGTFASRRGPLHQADRGPAVAALALGGIAAPAMTWAVGRRKPSLRAPVAAYSTVLAALLATSGVVEGDRGAKEVLELGTALFLLSDSLLGLRTFVLRDDHAALDSAVMATYTVAQAFIAGGLVHLGDQ